MRQVGMGRAERPGAFTRRGFIRVVLVMGLATSSFGPFLLPDGSGEGPGRNARENIDGPDRAGVNAARRSVRLSVGDKNEALVG